MRTKKTKILWEIFIGMTVSVSCMLGLIYAQSEPIITVDDTPVIAAPDIEGQGYIEKDDGTVVIYLK